jgi:hypothetical protein
MTGRAKGAFQVMLEPQGPDEVYRETVMGRMLIRKSFSGDLEGESRGQMLTAGASVKGSAGYVAIELVTGTLRGRNGSFVLQHRGVMNRGAPELKITVVPDSGTGQLEGISGAMTINIVDGKHLYEFEYSLESP